MPERQPAIAYIPAGLDRAAWAPEIEAHCRRRGYRLRALARHWREVVIMLTQDPEQVVVTGHPSHFPADGLPRFEAAAAPARGATAPGQRRAHRQTRDG